MAKADAARSLTAAVQQNLSPNTFHLSNIINLTNTVQSFSLPFTAALNDPNANVRFFTGANTFCVYIDKVSLKDVAVIAANEPVEIGQVNIGFKVFPNPFTENLKIKAEGIFKYQVFTITGFLLEEGKGYGLADIECSYPQGVYLLKIQQDQMSTMLKVVKE